MQENVHMYVSVCVYACVYVYAGPPRAASGPGEEVEKLVDHLRSKINLTNLANYGQNEPLYSLYFGIFH